MTWRSLRPNGKDLFAKVEKESMSDNKKLKQDIIQKFGTPCAVIDLDIVDKNIARLQALCDRAKLANRPHIKTHKSPLLASLRDLHFQQPYDDSSWHRQY